MGLISTLTILFLSPPHFYTFKFLFLTLVPECCSAQPPQSKCKKTFTDKDVDALVAQSRELKGQQGVLCAVCCPAFRLSDTYRPLYPLTAYKNGWCVSPLPPTGDIILSLSLFSSDHVLEPWYGGHTHTHVQLNREQDTVDNLDVTPPFLYHQITN